MTSPVSEASKISTEEAIQSWLVTQLVVYLKVDSAEIDPRRPFADYGLDSSIAISLTDALADWVGDELEPMLFWEYPSIEALSQYFAEKYTFPQFADPTTT